GDFSLCGLPEEARRGFASLSDPLEGLLVMLENSHDWRKGKAQSLAHYIIDQFSNWIKEDARIQQQSLLKRATLQVRVFSLLTEVPANMLDHLISLYEVDKTDPSSQLALVNDLCVKGKYKESRFNANYGDSLAVCGSFESRNWDRASIRSVAALVIFPNNYPEQAKLCQGE
ncbi:hypothetical protein scyTo_0022621, partial [Scyliorhinus torazame]|nr:hypothetical protein [Scyliorhinus torazame]